MATGGSDATTITSREKRETLTCALCLDIFRQPILFPCSHCLCLKCIKKLLDQASSTELAEEAEAASSPIKPQAQPTPAEATQRSEDSLTTEPEAATGSRRLCPSIKVTERGATSFPANVDIDPEELEAATDDAHCHVHQGKDMEMLCVDCDLLVCTECKMNDHLHHRSQRLETAVTLARAQLGVHKPRIQGVLDDLEKSVQRREKDQQEFQAKMAVVEREIQQRYSKIVKEAEKYRDDALAVLRSSSMDVERALSKDLDDVRRNRDKARYVLQRMDKAEQKNEGFRLVTFAMEMTSTGGSEAVAKTLTETSHVTEVRRPVHRSELPDDDVMFQTMKKFIGSCEVITMRSEEEEGEKELEVKEVGRCSDNDDVTVFCVKAEENKNINVSFDPVYNQPQPLAKLMNESSRTCETLTNNKEKEQGRVSFTVHCGGFYFYPTHACNIIFPKTVHAETIVYKLKNERSRCLIGTYEFMAAIEKKNEVLFSINVKSCRAFDVDSSQKYFVVVVEPDKPDTQRTVQLFKRPAGNSRVSASDTYKSPLARYQPADVCFYTVQGREVS